MPVRTPTLEEWFLAHQLADLTRRHVYNPIALELDATALADLWRARGASPPWTSLLVKAVGLAGRAVPEANRAWFPTLLGDRVIEFSAPHVALPVVLEADGREHVAAVTVREADRLSVAEIGQQLAASRRRTLDDTWLVKHVVRRRNTFIARLVLRLLHAFVYNAPRAFERNGGAGLAVSSTLRVGHRDRYRSIPFALGPGAVTVCAFSIGPRTDGRVVLDLGLAFDHRAVQGTTMKRFMDALHDAISGAHPGLHPPTSDRAPSTDPAFGGDAPAAAAPSTEPLRPAPGGPG